MNPPRQTVIDLFSGAGGLSLGFEQAGGEILVALDSDPVHLATHAFNFPLTEHLLGDAATTTGDELLLAAERAWRRVRTTGVFDGEVDGVIGGPSCQGFSVMGRRDANDPRNGLLLDFARLTKEVRPRWFVVENVPGILHARYRALLRKFADAVRASGYRLQGPMVLDAASFGIAQARRRAFIVGIRTGDSYRWPTPPGLTMSTATALSGLPRLEDYPALMTSDEAHLSDSDHDLLLSLTHPDFLRSDTTYPRCRDTRLLTSSRRTVHSEAVIERFSKLEPGRRDASSRLPRLAANRQSPTLRAGTGAERGSFTAARPVHFLYPRVITVREAARVQSFPDWFRFHTTCWHGFRQVGNAVPPKLAQAVATGLIRKVSEPEPVSTIPVTADSSLLTASRKEAAERFPFTPRFDLGIGATRH